MTNVIDITDRIDNEDRRAARIADAIIASGNLIAAAMVEVAAQEAIEEQEADFIALLEEEGITLE